MAGAAGRRLRRLAEPEPRDQDGKDMPAYTHPLPVPTAPLTTQDQFSSWLALLSDVDGAPYVHPLPVTWRDHHHRHNWKGHIPEAILKNSTYSEFWYAGKQGKQTWVALFQGPTGKEYGEVGAGLGDWHCWAVAVIAGLASTGGKRLVIWDCDPFLGTNDKPLVRTTQISQRSLVTWVRHGKKKGKLEVWYSLDTGLSGQDRCVEHACAKVEEWVAMGDMEFLGDGDPRVAGCVRLAP